jgi:hypothetical protein
MLVRKLGVHDSELIALVSSGPEPRHMTRILCADVKLPLKTTLLCSGCGVTPRSHDATLTPMITGSMAILSCRVCQERGPVRRLFQFVPFNSGDLNGLMLCLTILLFRHYLRNRAMAQSLGHVSIAT